MKKKTTNKYCLIVNCEQSKEWTGLIEWIALSIPWVKLSKSLLLFIEMFNSQLSFVA